ncbi:hypothetical protein CEQ90_01920 [Lewinellaceae bacterium SD302]|nr:hypothetical protein CEQ90_01920 [Lewinellaceae bacterium SD302]
MFKKLMAERRPILLASALSALIVLYGLIFLEWSVGVVIALYWYEMLLIAGFALGRILFALEGKGFFKGLFLRLFLTFMATLGMGLIMFFTIMLSTGSVARVSGTFSISSPGFSLQKDLLLIGYWAAFLVGFLFNGAFLRADPAVEFLRGMGRLGSVLAVILLSSRLDSGFFANSTPLATGAAIIIAKFLGEHWTSKIQVAEKD